jgi:hypothetical protein
VLNVGGYAREVRVRAWHVPDGLRQTRVLRLRRPSFW